jgi:hypothetical protein
MFDRLSHEPPGRAMDPLPGWLERRRQNLPAADAIVASLPKGPVFSLAARPAATPSSDDGRDEGPRADRERPLPTAPAPASRSAAMGPNDRPADRPANRDPRHFSNRRRGHDRSRRGGGPPR